MRTRAALALLVLAAACSGGGDDPSTTGSSDDARPPEAIEFAADWPLAGRDHTNTRAVPDSAITSETVDDLTELWRTPLEASGLIGVVSTTPIVIGDRIVLQTLDSTVWVLDRTTGDQIWSTTVESGLNSGPNGVAVGYGRIYAPKGTREIAALDLETGEELWATEIVATETGGITIQPQIADGLVLASTVPVSLVDQYGGGDRGVLHALDAATGEIVWTFDTVLGDDLWGNPEVNSGGGAWFTPSVDVDAGVVYWGVGNPAPFPGTEEYPNGSSRPGPNLYTDSVVALDLRTGELLWFDQVIEHDLFDRDHVHTMLVDTPDGRLLVSTGKGGIVVGHDLASGEELWRTPVGIHDGDELTELDGPTMIWPGTFGGVLTPPSAADGVVYVATLNAPTELSPDRPAYIGSELGTAPGEIVALDATTGEVLWSTEVDGDPLGGTAVVGDLVLTATHQGTLLALARSDGEIVWQMEAPGPLNAWPAIADDTIYWPIGLADPPVLLAVGLPG